MPLFFLILACVLFGEMAGDILFGKWAVAAGIGAAGLGLLALFFYTRKGYIR